MHSGYRISLYGTKDILVIDNHESCTVSRGWWHRILHLNMVRTVNSMLYIFEK